MTTTKTRTLPMCDPDEMVESIMNEIHCLHFEINKPNLSMRQDEEKLIQMNNQIHVVSAKFVQFNPRIGSHLLDFNRQMNTKIQHDDVLTRCHTSPLKQLFARPTNSLAVTYQLIALEKITISSVIQNSSEYT